MQAEIEAAEQSLAETEQRLSLDTDALGMALELAEDVAEVYAEAADSTKRSLNQAFSKRLVVMPEWDDEAGKTVRIIGAELTEPYATLLADGLAEGVLAEAESLQAERASEGQSGSLKPFAADSSYFVKMAGSRVQRLNADIALDRLVETLVEPVGRQARWQVEEAIRKADR
jgi:hypothetical protein